MTVDGRILHLDGWRGTAILLVLVGHFLPIPGSDAGRAGVELFFLLSGLLMGRLLLEKSVGLRRFFARRLGRVLPGLVAFLVVATALQAGFSGVFGRFDWSDTRSVLLFYSNYSFLEDRPGIFGHTWSLSIEEHSYVLLGLLALVVSRRLKPAAFVAIMLASIMWIRGLMLTRSGLGYHEVYWRTDVRGASIVLGFGLFAYRERLLAAINRYQLLVPVFSAVAVCMLLLRAVPNPLKYSLGTLACGLLLLSLDCESGARIRWLMEIKWLRWLGKYSYSIYLFQQIFHVAKPEFHRLSWPLLGVLAIVSGRLSYRFFEAPGQRIVDRLTARIGGSHH